MEYYFLYFKYPIFWLKHGIGQNVEFREANVGILTQFVWSMQAIEVKVDLIWIISLTKMFKVHKWAKKW